jgi:hypothetical protein
VRTGNVLLVAVGFGAAFTQLHSVTGALLAAVCCAIVLAGLHLIRQYWANR